MDQEPHEPQADSAARRQERRSVRRIRARARRKRFLERYEHRRAERKAGKHHPLKRPIRVTSGVLLILGGVAIGWLPGPGFIILALPGALLVASEWRRAAIIMDHVENETVPYVRHVHARLRGGPKPEWIAEHPHKWASWIEEYGYEIVDVDGDGVPDGVMVDLDGDGTTDGVVVDQDGDGTPDAIALDVDGDGFPETIITDVDGDGIPDVPDELHQRPDAQG